MYYKTFIRQKGSNSMGCMVCIGKYFLLSYHLPSRRSCWCLNSRNLPTCLHQSTQMLCQMSLGDKWDAISLSQSSAEGYNVVWLVLVNYDNASYWPLHWLTDPAGQTYRVIVIRLLLRLFFKWNNTGGAPIRRISARGQRKVERSRGIWDNLGQKLE